MDSHDRSGYDISDSITVYFLGSSSNCYGGLHKNFTNTHLEAGFFSLPKAGNPQRVSFNGFHSCPLIPPTVLPRETRVIGH